MRSQHIAFEELVDLCNDASASDGEVATWAREHLAAGCSRCAAELRSVKGLVGALRGSASIPTPEYAFDRARALYRERMRARSRPPLIARLAFDGLRSPALVGTRSLARMAFKRLYITASHDIDLWHEPVGEAHWYVIGQALPREDVASTPESATMTDSGGRSYEATLDGDEFHFASLPGGMYTLDLNLPSGRIVVPNAAIGA